MALENLYKPLKMNEHIASEYILFRKYLIIENKSCQFLCCLHYEKAFIELWGDNYIKIIECRNLDSVLDYIYIYIYLLIWLC